MNSLPVQARGFVVSWFFAPYLGSADLDLFKRLTGDSREQAVAEISKWDDRFSRLLQKPLSGYQRLKDKVRSRVQLNLGA